MTSSLRPIIIVLIILLPALFFPVVGTVHPDASSTVILPPPELKGAVSLEEAIYSRQSVRSFAVSPITLKDASQLLWAAGGKTIDGLTGATRSYPSAGGIYPLSIYLVAGNVTGLPAGVYRYDWKNHTLDLIRAGDLRGELTRAAWGQQFVALAPASIIITADVNRTSSRYGSRGGTRYVPMDVGHAGQNVSLQAQALGLGSVIVGAFQDKAVREVLGLKVQTPLYIIPVGKKGVGR